MNFAPDNELRYISFFLSLSVFFHEKILFLPNLMVFGSRVYESAGVR